MTVYIYGLQDPETKEIRYIGKANNPNVRYRQHIKGGCLNNQHKRGWINALGKRGLKPELIILETTDDKNWEMREKYWIKFGIDNDWPLTNISSGGKCYPSPIPKRYDWVEIMRDCLTKEEHDKFIKLPEDEQFKACHLLAIKVMHKQLMRSGLLT